ncbi:DUF1127 domain-containing protein [Nitratireductor mangrovi]|uniref:DUF1127 domain-containing protein n=1 Tax=Nitratireductor mangrovi TaxID=2599600 RepID=A0A5B8KVG5_9HYPH|nr:DUF1127 domain-containing protein [Nitratireductor mangrovi]QDY99561.1 DUF1127 domain-containing protein [Nitratireductor mangrovi]
MKKGTIDTFWFAPGDELHWSTALRKLRNDYVRRLVVSTVSAWQLAEKLAARQRSRGCLAELTDEQLKDIGVTRSEARREAGRPFWD